MHILNLRLYRHLKYYYFIFINSSGSMKGIDLRPIANETGPLHLEPFCVVIIEHFVLVYTKIQIVKLS